MKSFRKGNVVVFSNNLYYQTDHARQIAHALKSGDAEAVAIAATAIRNTLPSWDNVAIVPIPSHLGYATYTLELAKAIGQGHVFDILRSAERETLYDLKYRGMAVTPNDLGFYTIGSIPQDMNVVFVDNVVATGTTAMAALEAVGRGFVVPFAIDERAFKE